MGVAGLFKWLINRLEKDKFMFAKNSDHRLSIEDKTVNNIDCLMIDTNCLLHPMCFEVLANVEDDISDSELEKKMLKRIIEYIQSLIDHTEPNKLVYIAIDGVAPVAKIKQQRTRRFKSVKDKKTFDSIKRKHGKSISKYWNNSAITPGTVFMEKITKKIKDSIVNKKIKVAEGVKIIFSSANTPSEGEHKLVQYIRNTKEDYNYVIYGLDADLIFLALATNKPNIYLLREAQICGETKYDDFMFVSIDRMKKEIINYMKEHLLEEVYEYETEDNNLINDFIFISYLLGNDFLPHIPSLDIQVFDRRLDNGMDLVMGMYCEVMNLLQEPILKLSRNNGELEIKFNQEFIKTLFDRLGCREDEYFYSYNSNKGKKKRYIRCYSSDPYDIEMFRLDNLLFKHNDPVRYGDGVPEEWRYRYYNYYCNLDEEQTSYIQNMTNAYCEGLVWVAYYYFDKCPSWEWYYKYPCAPFMSDLAKNVNEFDFNGAYEKFVVGKSLRPMEQLMCVLPSKSSYLLPDRLAYLMKSYKSPLIHLYPVNYELDMVSKHRYWQCEPILPELDIKLVQYVVSKRDLTKDECERNKICKPYVYN